MTFQCDDLRELGLILVPNTSPEYEPLLADIRQRIYGPRPELAGMPEPVRKGLSGRISPDKLSTSAILLNGSARSIAALALVWHYEEADGRTYTKSSGHIPGRSVLLPFAARPEFQAIHSYWHVILPGSKRYLAEDGIAGDNTDVRLPRPEEIWRGGGIFGGGGAGSGQPRSPVKEVKLVLDGVFFTDGGFAGPDSYGMWAQITSEAAVRMDVASTAREGRNRGVSAGDILEEIETITGQPRLLSDGHKPVPPGPGADWRRQFHLQQHANEIAHQRRNVGDDATIEWLAAQADVRLPVFTNSEA